jgi:hypothetical protein
VSFPVREAYLQMEMQIVVDTTAGGCVTERIDVFG